jgi:hypothetical protein
MKSGTTLRKSNKSFAPRRSGYMHRDLMAIKSGTIADGGMPDKRCPQGSRKSLNRGRSFR